MRDFEGDVVVALCCTMEGGEDVVVAEALSARTGLKTAIEAGFVNLILEVDYLQLFTHLKERRCDPTPFGKIVQDIRMFAAQCSHVSFSHIKRKGNVVAHSLVKLCNSKNGLNVWLEEFPSAIASAVSADMCMEYKYFPLSRQKKYIFFYKN